MEKSPPLLRNSYRQILRRDYPEPLLALLAFIMGIWLWDHYFGQTDEYPPGTEEIALIKIDRDLRLADAMTADPAWLRWLAGTAEPAVAREHALEELQNLSRGHAMTVAGAEAFAVIEAIQTGAPIQTTLANTMQGQTHSDFAESSELLATHQGTWWHAKLVETWEHTRQPVCFWRTSFNQEALTLRSRSIWLRSAVWVLGIAGLAFIPNTLSVLQRGLRAVPRGYGGAWPLPLGLMVFLAATLAWVGFTQALELGIFSLPNLHPAMTILLDSAARVLPSLIAMALLFRRPRHAARVLGLNREFAGKTIFGLFALLLIADQLLHSTLGRRGAAEPGGSLSMGEAGVWGLVFALVSACVLAPLAEEVLYRGVLFRAVWNRLGVMPAALISSAIFAMLHFYNGYGLASVGIFGLACALLYASTGSLGACVTLHLLYNAAIKIPEWLIYHDRLS